MVNTGGKVQRAESTVSRYIKSIVPQLVYTITLLGFYILHFITILVFTVLTSDQRDVTVPGLG